MAGYRRVNYYELCRLCTSSDGTKLHIFREEGRRRQIPTKIQMCLPLQINEEDSLPKSICTSCVDKLESFFNFREACLTAEAMLEGFQDYKREGMVYVKDESVFKTETALVKSDDPTNVQVVETSCMVPVSVEGLQNLAVHIINDPTVDHRGTQYKIPIPLQLQCGTAVLDPSQQIRYNIAEVSSQQPSKTVQAETTIIQNGGQKEVQTYSEKSTTHTASGTQTDAEREVVISQTTMNNEMFVQFATNFKDTPTQEDIVQRADMSGITNINDYLRTKTEEVTQQQLAEEAKDIECGRCGKRLSSAEVTEHCIMCFEQQPPPAILNDHQSQHIVEKINNQDSQRHPETIIQYSCDICGKVFKIKDAFEEHHKTHSAENGDHQASPQNQSVVVSYQNQVNVSDINTQTPQQQEFLVELKQEEPSQNQAVLPCEVCGKPFKRKEHLFQHRKLHSGERPFVCSTCGKAFGRKEHLLRHMLAHTGQKVHDCDLCGKSFSRKDNLLKHRKIHGIAGPFNCEACGKSFVVKHYYLLHLNSHQNEGNGDDATQFRCDVCNKTFPEKSQLMTHKARHRSRPSRVQPNQHSLQQQQQQQQHQQQNSLQSTQLTQSSQSQSPGQPTSNPNEENTETLSTVNTAAILAPNILHTSSAQVFQMPSGTTYLCAAPSITANQIIDNLRRLHAT